MYFVYQDGKLADHATYPKVHFTWDQNKGKGFETKKEAIKYALKWAYPYQEGEINNLLEQTQMELNKPVDMSMCEIPVMMEIRVNNETA